MTYSKFAKLLIQEKVERRRHNQCVDCGEPATDKCEDCGDPLCQACIIAGRQYPAAVCWSCEVDLKPEEELAKT